MLDSVHEFVSECQKGFTPSTFIAEVTMLINLTKAYINEEDTGRHGLYIFLDMEKAFDRVSYGFIKKALKAVGFGPEFIRCVSMMYNQDAPPTRRIYANGYYSSAFSIISGVAQGCPLSPLLFLLVGEALRTALSLSKKVKGITIGSTTQFVAQFADDTVLLLGDKKELFPALKAVEKWCAATGMRENKDKREGIAMGTYRYVDLNDINLGRFGTVDWVNQRDPSSRLPPWAIHLGVPIGNNLDVNKWWTKKLEAIDGIGERWIPHLRRRGYFGRDLIVQSMYFGRMRYWLYSVEMPKNRVIDVQTQADILWWSRTPKITDKKKVHLFEYVDGLKRRHLFDLEIKEA